jgi:hypothetical protein
MKKLFFTLVAIFGISSIAHSNALVSSADYPIEKDQVITASVPISALAASMDETVTFGYYDSRSRPVTISITIVVIQIGDRTVVVVSGTISYTTLEVSYNVDGTLENGNFNYTITDESGTPLSLSECVDTMDEVMEFLQNQLINY